MRGSSRWDCRDARQGERDHSERREPSFPPPEPGSKHPAISYRQLSETLSIHSSSTAPSRSDSSTLEGRCCLLRVQFLPPLSSPTPNSPQFTSACVLQQGLGQDARQIVVLYTRQEGSSVCFYFMRDFTPCLILPEQDEIIWI